MASIGDAADIAAIYRPSVTDAATSFEVDAPGRRRDRAPRSRRCSRGALAGLHRPGWRHGRLRVRRPAPRRAAYQWSVDVDRLHPRRPPPAGRRPRALRRAFELLRLQGFCVAHAGITLPNAAASACTSRWASARSASIRRWAGSSARGATSAGGSSRCRSWSATRRRPCRRGSPRPCRRGVRCCRRRRDRPAERPPPERARRSPSSIFSRRPSEPRFRARCTSAAGRRRPSRCCSCTAGTFRCRSRCRTSR